MNSVPVMVLFITMLLVAFASSYIMLSTTAKLASHVHEDLNRLDSILTCARSSDPTTCLSDLNEVNAYVFS